MARRALWSAAALVCATAQASADVPGADYYRGKTVTYIVATAPGGGYDAYGRLVAEHMQRALPGATFVVRNMPGAGHLIGTNALYASKPDGLTIGTFNTGLIYTQIARHEGVKFDLTQMSWIGKAATDPRVIVVAEQSPVRSFADIAAAKQPLKFATSGPGGANFVETLALAATLKLPLRMMAGYNGTDDQLAMRRGEIDGTIGSRSSFDGFVKNGFGRYVAQFGGSDTDTPQLADLVSDPDGRRLVKLVTTQGDIARLTAGPPAIPPAQLATLRGAYRAALSSKDFQERAEKMERPVEALYGEEVAARVKEALQQSPEVTTLLVEGFKSAK